jgi:hypothetical protein
MGTLSLDFEDEEAYNMALRVIGSKQMAGYSGHRDELLQIRNERGQIRGWMQSKFHSYTAGPIEDFEAMTFALPPHGTPPPPREGA